MTSDNGQRRIGWRVRIASLRHIQPLLSLMWSTSPQLTTASVVLRICRAVLPVALLWVAKLLLDAILAVLSGQQTAATVWRLLAVELFLAVLNDVLTRLNTLSDSLLGDRFTNRLSVLMMARAHNLDLASYEDSTVYDRLERARNQTTGRLILLVSLLNMGQDIVGLAALSSGLMLLSPWLLIALACGIVPAFVGESHFSTLAYSALYRWTPQRRQLDYLRFLGASIQSVKEVKIFGLGPYLVARYQEVSDTIYKDTSRIAVKRALVGSALALVGTAGYYGAYIVILANTLAGMLSIGTFTFLTGSFVRARASLERIVSSFTDVSQAALALKDVFGFLDMKPSICSSPGARRAPRTIRAGLEFRNVSFAYPGSDRLSLRRVNLRIRPTETLALVGENGAGKTTLVKLLARLYDPTEGAIYLDGVDLREYDVDDYHSTISVIFQDFMRYDLLVRDNIAFGDFARGHDHARVVRAAQKSGADEFINRLPSGYVQMVGKRFESGTELSGGEWQKLALARAYMRDASVIILDEPTATLDARAEYEVFQRFADLARDRLAVIISHRFSTVRLASRIVVLANGEIEEQGTHEELLSRGAHYSELFRLQAAGYQ